MGCLIYLVLVSALVSAYLMTSEIPHVGGRNGLRACRHNAIVYQHEQVWNATDGVCSCDDTIVNCVINSPFSDNPTYVGDEDYKDSSDQYGGNPDQFGGNPDQFGGNPDQFGGNPDQFGGNPDDEYGNKE